MRRTDIIYLKYIIIEYVLKMSYLDIIIDYKYYL